MRIRCSTQGFVCYSPCVISYQANVSASAPSILHYILPYLCFRQGLFHAGLASIMMYHINCHALSECCAVWVSELGITNVIMK